MRPVSGRQHRGGDVGHVRASHRCHQTVAGRAGDHVLLAGHERQEVEVEAVPQDGRGQPAFAQSRLGEEVVPGESEGGVRGGPQEGRVDDPRYAGVGGRVDRPVVLSIRSGCSAALTSSRASSPVKASRSASGSS